MTTISLTNCAPSSSSSSGLTMWIKRFSSLGLALVSSLVVFALANDDKLAVARASNYLGIPGVDFPILDTVPVTGFKCDSPGYFGDVETRCQVFHICQSGGRRDSFLCPNGTLFNQKFLVCDWWFNVDCTGAPTLYSRNAEIFAAAPSSAVAATTARWHDATQQPTEKSVLLKQHKSTTTTTLNPDSSGVGQKGGAGSRYGARRVSVNRMGGAATAAVAASAVASVESIAALEAFNSDESTTILPADSELGVPLRLDLVEDPGVTPATDRPVAVVVVASSDAADDAPPPIGTVADAEADVVTDAPVTEASRRPSSVRPSTYGRKGGQSFIALSHSSIGQVGQLVTEPSPIEYLSTASQVAPIDSPVTVSPVSPTTEPYQQHSSHSVEPLLHSAASQVHSGHDDDDDGGNDAAATPTPPKPSRTLEPPPLVYFQPAVTPSQRNASAHQQQHQKQQTFVQHVDTDNHLTASAATASVSSSSSSSSSFSSSSSSSTNLKQEEKQEPIKTGGVKHLNSKFGSRIGKKAHKSLLF